MERSDRNAIANLFERLADVERRSPPRDREAEAFIADQIRTQPGAPYYLAQTVIVQQQALEAAQERIADLEARAARGSVPSVFGSRHSGARVDRHGWEDRRQPWGGGGFLAGAAQTALGVAGGVLLGNMIAGTFFGGDAQAADSGGDDGDVADADAGNSFDAGGFDFGGE
jgi:hypothetical protein